MVLVQGDSVGKLALQSVTLTLKLPLKMPYFPDEESFTFVAFKTDSSIKWKLVYSRIIYLFLRWDLTFPARRGVKLPISVRE